MTDRVFRFGAFEVNEATGELRKQGIRIKLHSQPFQILVMLLERPSELVTREEMRQRLWGEDTFVDFDHGLNTAVNKLREALGDLASQPRHVETVSGTGYRFIAPVTLAAPASKASVEPVAVVRAAVAPVDAHRAAGDDRRGHDPGPSVLLRGGGVRFSAASNKVPPTLSRAAIHGSFVGTVTIPPCSSRELGAGSGDDRGARLHAICPALAGSDVCPELAHTPPLLHPSERQSQASRRKTGVYYPRLKRLRKRESTLTYKECVTTRIAISVAGEGAKLAADPSTRSGGQIEFISCKKRRVGRSE